MLKQTVRLGVYGLVIEEGNILLHTKANGPYKGRLSLPGGGLEFGEAPEETLKREIREELAMSFTTMALWDSVAYAEATNFRENEIFHFVGIIYKISGLKPLTGCIAEESFDWYRIEDLQKEALLPLAEISLRKLNLIGCEKTIDAFALPMVVEP
jgi:mutator protein MutT